MTTEAPVDVLLVEDNPMDAELTMRALRRVRLANPIVHVTDGAQALEFLFGVAGGQAEPRRPMPKVIFLDVKLPKVSGLEVLERLKADPRTKDVPVVMLTSSAESPDVREAYRLGANSYVVKPMDFQEFVDAVSKLGLYWLFINNPPR